MTTQQTFWFGIDITQNPCMIYRSKKFELSLFDNWQIYSILKSNIWAHLIQNLRREHSQ